MASRHRDIARAAGVVSALTLLSRFGGLVRDAVIGYWFGGGMAADAFFVAFRIPNLLRRFVAEGAMSAAFVPVFADYFGGRGRVEAVRAVRAVLSVFVLVTAALTAIGMGLAPWWTGLFAPGFAAEPAKLELTVSLTRWLFPYVFLVSVVGVLGGLLNALRRFAVPAASPLVLNLCIIVATALLVSRVEPPVYALAYGVLLGGLAQVLLHVVPLRALGIDVRPLWLPGHEAVRRVFRLLAPTMFGTAVFQVNLLVSTMLASVLPAGAVSYLWYADRVFEFPLGLVAVALGTVALPSFSAHAASGDHDAFARDVEFACRMTLLTAVPATVGLAALALPITSVLFLRGAFSAADVAPTAAALAAYNSGLLAVSLARVLAPAFYALGDARTPVVTAAVAVIANLLFSFMLIGVPIDPGGEWTGRMIAGLALQVSVADLRHVGLALATSMAALLNCALLALLLRQRLPAVRWRVLVPTLARTIVASAAMLPVLWGIAAVVHWESSGFTVRLVALGAAVSAGALVYAAAAWLLGSPEIRAVSKAVFGRLPATRGPRGPQ